MHWRHYQACFLTVTLKVMDFCRPSGEICRSSATTRISWALTTDATSWDSVCQDKESQKSNLLHGTSEIEHYSAASWGEGKDTSIWLSFFVPRISRRRHFLSGGWKTGFWRYRSGLRHWSEVFPWRWGACGNPPHHSCQQSHSLHP